MEKVGRPKGNNNKETIISMRLDEATRNRLEAYCKRMHKSRSEVIREAVDSFVEGGKEDLNDKQEILRGTLWIN